MVFSEYHNMTSQLLCVNLHIGDTAFPLPKLENISQNAATTTSTTSKYECLLPPLEPDGGANDVTVKLGVAGLLREYPDVTGLGIDLQLEGCQNNIGLVQRQVRFAFDNEIAWVDTPAQPGGPADVPFSPDADSVETTFSLTLENVGQTRTNRAFQLTTWDSPTAEIQLTVDGIECTQVWSQSSFRVSRQVLRKTRIMSRPLPCP